jgi:solute carrier family 35 protein
MIILRHFISRNIPLLTAVAYGIVSISITFFNKAVLSSYKFHHPNLMTLSQILFSLFFLSVLKFFDMISYIDLDVSIARKMFPLSICFVGMVLTGLSALNQLNVPMFSALRRATCLLTMYCEVQCQAILLMLDTF